MTGPWTEVAELRARNARLATRLVQADGVIAELVAAANQAARVLMMLQLSTKQQRNALAALVDAVAKATGAV